ncbi:hypothetical protein [Photobacterium leiognathi]|uniref:hypothetical protein n=1 Tax=Photobacterium leiognathi TaxID=553611 RepID=UPI0029817AAB|nr:hypothetical protein [Photobacterium leiognathi]
MKLMNQPINGYLGDDLIELLGSTDYDTLNIVVAFAKNSGVLRIKDSLDNFRKRGGTVNLFIGVDLGVTSYEALTALLICSDSLSVVHSEKSQTFHPKIYQFLGKEKGMIVVGSHNLTGGGLWTNFESSVHIPLDISNPDSSRLLRDQEEYLNALASLKDSIMPIKSKDDVDLLLNNGYISKEVSQRVRQCQENKLNKDINLKPLFGNGVQATLPRMSELPKDEMAAGPSVFGEQEINKTTDSYKTIWFETRRLTGGSRNILDLSMRSLVEKGDPEGTPFDLGEPRFMRGAVEFFGVDPSSTNVRKDITLNFEGVNYESNTILFPVGDSANGTWRLQIKGVSPSQERITDAFRAKGEDHYLVQKVVTFTKVTDDYYSIAVFPESELENFKKASSILARNGATTNAKLLGLL